MLQLTQLIDFVNKQLQQEVDLLDSREPANLYHPVVYTLNMGGKRIRPVLLLMAYNLYKENIEHARNSAIAIEMFHNFTLLHDDIMDNADLRRNYETVHLKYSNEAAILSGDAMSILSYEYINKCESKNYREIFQVFTRTALQICEGQQYDMDFETRDDVTVEEYLKMIGLKTAVLLAASLKIGVLEADGTMEDANNLYNFGYNLGMAFQLQDDLLDSFGDTNSFGKNIGGDIVSNKKTFLMLKALELAKGEKQQELLDLISLKEFKREEKIEKVKNIYKDLGVVKLSQQKMEEYYELAIMHLDRLDVEKSRKTILLDTANKMMKRTS